MDGLGSEKEWEVVPCYPKLFHIFLIELNVMDQHMLTFLPNLKLFLAK